MAVDQPSAILPSSTTPGSTRQHLTAQPDTYLGSPWKSGPTTTTTGAWHLSWHLSWPSRKLDGACARSSKGCFACRCTASMKRLLLATTKLGYPTPGTGSTVIIIYLLPRTSAWTSAGKGTAGRGTPRLIKTNYSGPTKQRGDQKFSHSNSPYAQLPLPLQSALRNNMREDLRQAVVPSGQAVLVFSSHLS